MSSAWVKPVNVAYTGGTWGLGTVRGGPFADHETYSVSQRFGARWDGTWHGGLDIAFPLGTMLYAIGDGRALVGYDPVGAGHFVVVERADGYRYEYLHLNAPPVVATGAQVTQGQFLGYGGRTGNSSGPHLHINIIRGGNWDPLAFLEAGPDIGEVVQAVEQAPPYHPAAVLIDGGVGEHYWVHHYDLIIPTTQFGPNLQTSYVGRSPEGNERWRVRLEDWA